MLSGKVFFEKTSNPQSNIAVYLSDSKGNRLSEKASHVSITNGTGLYSFPSTYGAKYVSVKCVGNTPITQYIGNKTLVNFDIDKCGSTELDEVSIKVPVKDSDNQSIDLDNSDSNQIDDIPETTNSESKGKLKIRFKNLSKGQKASVYMAGFGFLGLITSFIIKK